MGVVGCRGVISSTLGDSVRLQRSSVSNGNQPSGNRIVYVFDRRFYRNPVKLILSIRCKYESKFVSLARMISQSVAGCKFLTIFVLSTVTEPR